MNPYQYIKFVDDGNEKFVRGDSKLLVNKEEIHQNINLKMGLPPILDDRERKWLIGRVRFVVLFWLFFTGLMSFVVVYSTRNGYITNTPQATHIVMILLVVGPMFFCVKSIRALSRVIASVKPPQIEETEKLFDQLVHSGTISTGEILASEWESGMWKLTYRFVNNQGETIQGDYWAGNLRGVSYKMFVHHDKVSVLYLDEQLHILL